MELVQQSQSDSCLACIMAMIVGESEQYVLDWFEYYDPPFCDDDVFLFLAHHGIYFGLFLDLDKDMNISRNQEFKVCFNLNTRKAWIIVDSPTRSDRTHAVFWNGKKILDPLKDMPQDIEEYNVIRIFPMITTKRRGVNNGRL